MIINYLKQIGTKRKQSKSDESIPKKKKKQNVLVGFDNKGETLKRIEKMKKTSTCWKLAWVYENKSQLYILSEGLEIWWS